MTDVFSTNARAVPSPSGRSNNNDDVVKVPLPAPMVSPVKAKVSKTNTDSGYHGMSEDDIDTDEIMVESAPAQTTETLYQNNTHGASRKPEHATNLGPQVERSTTTEGSFHSAMEEPLENGVAKVATQESTKDAGTNNGRTPLNSPPSRQASPTVQQQLKIEDLMHVDGGNENSALEDPIDESQSPSQGSSPVKPLVRKSSLTFAALPAREPLTTKKSMGARVSRTSHIDQAKGALNRGSFLGRFTNGKSLGATKNVEVDPSTNVAHVDAMDIDGEENRPAMDRKESDGDSKMTKLHNKSSTQRLHDKISMLGKSQAARPTKSIPAAMATHPLYPELPSTASNTAHPACLHLQLQNQPLVQRKMTMMIGSSHHQHNLIKQGDRNYSRARRQM